MILKVGQPAPNFNLPDQNNNFHKLTDYQGKWLLLYFYPKDDTPGCVKEACGMRDNMETFSKLKAKVVGVNVDSVQSHDKFVHKYQLPFTLLADEEKKIVNDYGVWEKKKILGKEFEGIARTSFLINPEGRIAKIYEKVNPLIHTKEVIKDLDNLKA
jgi:peroxiredoxin Q/BCP